MAALNVALIGTGMMGRLHSLALATLPSFFPDLPAVRRSVVVDVTEELAQRGAHQFGYDEWALDWKKAIARPDIDVVNIVTPNDSHRPIAEFAMSQGKHVLCEKPLALSASGRARDGRAVAPLQGYAHGRLQLSPLSCGPGGQEADRRRGDRRDPRLPRALPSGLGDAGRHALELAVRREGSGLRRPRRYRLARARLRAFPGRRSRERVAPPRRPSSPSVRAAPRRTLPPRQRALRTSKPAPAPTK